MNNIEMMRAAKEAARAARENAKTYHDGYWLMPDSTPGTGWKVFGGPVIKYYQTREKAIAGIANLPPIKQGESEL